MIVLIVYSVRHTGTRFVTDYLLRKNGFRNGNDPDDVAQDPEAHRVYREHVGDPKYGAWAHLEYRGNIVIPLRRLDRVIVSWERRGRPLDELAGALRTLIERFDHRRPMYLPIDSPRRDEFLAALGRQHHIDLRTDWAIGPTEKGSADAGPEDIKDMERAAALHAEFRGFFSRFY